MYLFSWEQVPVQMEIWTSGKGVFRGRKGRVDRLTLHSTVQAHIS
jgi:hypothetical protein